MKKLILSVVATSLLATSMFAETSKNGNKIVNKLITCNNGADGFETTISNLDIDRVMVKYNSCDNKGIVVAKIESYSIRKRGNNDIDLLSSDFFEKNNIEMGVTEITNKDGVIVGNIVNFETNKGINYYESNLDKETDIYIDNKKLTIQLTNDELIVK